MTENVSFSIPKYDPNLIAEYRKEFDRVDVDKNQYLDKKEFIDYLVQQGQSTKMAKITYKIVDMNHDHQISFDEFADYIHAACEIVTNNDVNAYLRLVFRASDKKKDNHLDKKGFKKFMKFMDIPVGFFDANKKFKKFDTDKSGTIEFDEITRMYHFEMEKDGGK
ncbi:EF hand family protein [Tritrichomonas foetus]|uniref:EF hand family protein n=1 Tax=Tritrichomonas foetus TaxID=1144522 RepID=A0A1J4K0B1_9EUKA|nr:EF hand family protein [Tritrichomonas foetus]|eukprot:OHT04168.1 EF hand family protein [Tritrichomonas foetus]